MEEQNESEEFFPNLRKSITKRGLGARPIMESQIKAAQEKSKSAFTEKGWNTEYKISY